jgi:Tfp pilus assembly PilM family ATPase
VDFYLVSNPGSRITHVTLVGGNALLPGLKERIDESLSGAFEVERYTAHVEIGNPLASYDLAKGCSPRPQEVPMLAVVLGLTLAGGVRHESGK